MYRLQTIRTEAATLTALAIPSVIAQLSQMSMGFVDTLMVAQIGSRELAGVGSAAAIYYLVVVFCYGMISAVGPMVSQAFGAGDHDEIERVVTDGIWMALALSAFGMVIYWNIGVMLRMFGQEPEVILIAESYVRAMSWGFPAAMLFGVLRISADAIGKTRVAMVISFVAVFINGAFNYLLIFGELGFPRLGATGAGYSTAIVKWSMLAMIMLYLLRSRDFERYDFRSRFGRPDFRRLAAIARIGLPIGTGQSMENGFFGLTALLMGQLSSTALAAHQIAINCAAFTFMVPMGVSIAIATRVGQAIGRRDHAAASLAGWVGIGVSGMFMVTTAILFILFRFRIIDIYTDDPATLDYAAGLLMIAGAFQISDGLQVGAMGALRGLKDTARPLLTNMFAYWLIGMPTGWLLGFQLGYGGQGLWWGLTIGLSVAAVMHTLRFRKLVGDTGEEVAVGVEVPVR
jgi:MATE family multidrug resistance protein